MNDLVSTIGGRPPMTVEQFVERIARLSRKGASLVSSLPVASTDL
jgi:hypothetical protein